MKPVWTAFVAATAIQAFGDVVTYQLPRSLEPMSVLALVECLDDGPDGLGCKVSQYCGSPDDWDAGVSIDTFDDIGTVAKGGLKWWPPYSANEQGDVIVGWLDANRLCAVAVDGEANITAFREHRRKDDAGAWVYLSRETVPIHRAGSAVKVLRTVEVRTLLDEWLSRKGITMRQQAESRCEHIRKDSPQYNICIETELNHVYIHRLNVTAADEHMLCILDAFWENERDDDDAMRRIEYAVRNSLSGTYNGPNSWQGTEGLSDCAELRPDLSEDD